MSRYRCTCSHIHDASPTPDECDRYAVPARAEMTGGPPMDEALDDTAAEPCRATRQDTATDGIGTFDVTYGCLVPGPHATHRDSSGAEWTT